MPDRNDQAAVCHTCPTLFSFEPRDIFAGEVFCPGCATRAPKEQRYDSVTEAKRAHPRLAVI